MAKSCLPFITPHINEKLSKFLKLPSWRFLKRLDDPTCCLHDHTFMRKFWMNAPSQRLFSPSAWTAEVLGTLDGQLVSNRFPFWRLLNWLNPKHQLKCWSVYERRRETRFQNNTEGTLGVGKSSSIFGESRIRPWKFTIVLHDVLSYWKILLARSSRQNGGHVGKRRSC